LIPQDFKKHLNYAKNVFSEALEANSRMSTNLFTVWQVLISTVKPDNFFPWTQLASLLTTNSFLTISMFAFEVSDSGFLRQKD